MSKPNRSRAQPSREYLLAIGLLARNVGGFEEDILRATTIYVVRVLTTNALVTVLDPLAPFGLEEMHGPAIQNQNILPV
jgi:hypothetical protein